MRVLCLEGNERVKEKSKVKERLSCPDKPRQTCHGKIMLLEVTTANDSDPFLDEIHKKNMKK